MEGLHQGCNCSIVCKKDTKAGDRPYIKLTKEWLFSVYFRKLDCTTEQDDDLSFAWVGSVGQVFLKL